MAQAADGPAPEARKAGLWGMGLIFGLLCLAGRGALPQARDVPESAPRLVSLKVALDESLRPWGMTKASLRQWLRAPSQTFEKRFGIRFELAEIEAWKPGFGPRSIQDLMEDLRRTVRQGDRDIVLGLVSPEKVRGGAAGLASYLSGTIVLRAQESKAAMAGVLLHEICHLFGAIDLREKDSIMSEEIRSARFDEWTSKLVLLHGQRSFLPGSFPLSPDRLDEAIALYGERAALGRGESRLGPMLAALYFEKRDLPAAARECAEALKRDPQSIELHSLLGAIYRSQDDDDRAIAAYRQALRSNPDSPEVHYNLGLSLAKKGLTEEAVAEFKEAAERDPDEALARSNLSFFYLQMGRFGEAIEAGRAALRSSPELVEACCNLAAGLIMRRESGDPEREPGGPEAQAGEGSIEEAVGLCRRALALRPNLPEVHNVLAIAYELQDRMSEAEAEFMTALELKPDFTEVHFNLGIFFFRRSDFERAAFHLKRIMDIDPSTGLGRQILARAYEGQEDLLFPQIRPVLASPLSRRVPETEAGPRRSPQDR